MLVAVGAFACLDTLLKLLTQHYPPLQVGVMRGAASIPFLALPALISGNASALKPRRLHWHITRGLLMVLVMTSFIYALRVLSLADTYAIFLSAPLIVTALSVPILKEHVGWRRWTAISVGMCGVLIMLRPSGSGFLTIGALAALVAAVGYAVNVITLRILTRTETAASVTLWQMVVLVVVMSVLAAPEWAPIQLEHWGWIAAIGAVGAVATRMLTEAFRAAPASVVAPFEYTALPWAVLVDWAVWSTLPSARMFYGGGLVIASGLYLIWRERQLRQ
jgi:drug/metabolite transporter (DMT)-like permease